MPTENKLTPPLPEVKRWKLKGFIPGIEGESKAVFRPVVVLADDFNRVAAERDALQLRLNATDERADELAEMLALASVSVDYHASMKGEDGEHLYDLLARIRATFKNQFEQPLGMVSKCDELTQRNAEPVEWGAPKTVRQLIRQLETLDQDLRPLSMLRVPGNVFEDGKERTRAVHLSFSHERVDGQWLAPIKSECEKVLAFWCRMEQPAPAAVVPDGYCLMPTRLTAENGAKALLLGEFKLQITNECPECRELEEPLEGCEICDGEGEYGQQHMIPWDQIKFIYSEAVKGLAKKPNTPQ